MISRMFVSLAMATVSLIFAAGCSHDAKKKSLEKTQASSEIFEKKNYATIVFEKGTAKLEPSSKRSLINLAEAAEKDIREIEEIKILAWSDTEYPDKVEGRADQKEIILASERAQTIRDYLENELEEENDIDAYNMAKRPNILSKILQNDEFKVKKAFEESGTTGAKLPDGSMAYSKASKALVIVDYK